MGNWFFEDDYEELEEMSEEERLRKSEAWDIAEQLDIKLVERGDYVYFS